MRLHGSRPPFDLTWSLVVALAILGPALVLPGYVLRGDMVFVPDQPWKDAWLGLDGSVPRAVPMDAVVSLLSLALPGWLVQKGLLLLVLVVGGVGAGRLVAKHPWFARAGAITLFLWNPWVAERLLIGQWAAVGGYAVLPWVVLAAEKVSGDVRRGWPGIVVALTVCSVFSPSSGLMGVLVALAVVLVHPRAGSVATVLVSGCIASLPWLVPSLLVPDGIGGGGSSGFASFAARGESSLGAAASLFSLGGIWKTSVVPGERTSAFIVAAACAVTVIALLGLRQARRTQERGRLIALGTLAATCFVLISLSALGPVAEQLDSATAALPSLAILRDSHRYLAPAVLVLVVGFAAALDWLAATVRPGREAVYAVVALLGLLPVLLLPGLAWGAGGKLSPVDYPDEWTQVADLVGEAEHARTVVLPWTGSYRGFSWNHYRAMLDPAPRFLPGEVLIDDRVLLGDVTLPSEDQDLVEIGAALGAPDAAAELRGLGVRWVLVEKGHVLSPVPAGRTVHDGPALQLVDLGIPDVSPHDRPPRAVIVMSDTLALGILVIAVATIARRRMYASAS